MDTILMKYRVNDREYIIYDMLKYHEQMRPRTVRSICSRNFGMSAEGLMVGPVLQDGGMTMKIYSPEGEERPMEEDAMAAGRRYLADAGYIHDDQEKNEEASMVGKGFLSESLVKVLFR